MEHSRSFNPQAEGFNFSAAGSPRTSAAGSVLPQADDSLAQERARRQQRNLHRLQRAGLGSPQEVPLNDLSAHLTQVAAEPQTRAQAVSERPLSRASSYFPPSRPMTPQAATPAPHVDPLSALGQLNQTLQGLAVAYTQRSSSGSGRRIRVESPKTLVGERQKPGTLLAFVDRAWDCFEAQKADAKDRVILLRSFVDDVVQQWLATFSPAMLEAILTSKDAFRDMMKQRWILDTSEKELRADLQSLRISSSVQEYAESIKRLLAQLNMCAGTAPDSSTLKEWVRDSIKLYNPALLNSVLASSQSPYASMSAQDLLALAVRLDASFRQAGIVSAPSPASSSWRSTASPSNKPSPSTPSRPTRAAASLAPAAAAAVASPAPGTMPAGFLAATPAQREFALQWQRRVSPGKKAFPPAKPIREPERQLCFNCCELGHHASDCSSPRVDFAATLHIKSEDVQASARAVDPLAQSALCRVG